MPRKSSSVLAAGLVVVAALMTAALWAGGPASAFAGQFTEPEMGDAPDVSEPAFESPSGSGSGLSSNWNRPSLRRQLEMEVAFVDVLSKPDVRLGLRLSGDFAWQTRPGITLVARGHLAATLPGQDPNRKSFEAGLDRFFLQCESGPVRISLGRQAVNWGLATLFRPTDLITPRHPMKPEEGKPGSTLATLFWRTSPITAIELVLGENLCAGRAGFRMGQTNLRVLAMAEPASRRNAFGLDFEGGLWGLYGELSHDRSDEAPRRSGTAATIGWKKTFGRGNTVFAECYRLNIHSEYAEVTTDLAAAGVTYAIDEFTSVGLVGITDLHDSAWTAAGTLTALLTDTLDLNCSVSLAAGPSNSALDPQVAANGKVPDEIEKTRAQAQISLKWYL